MYRHILKQALKVVFKNKILWFLGFWVALMGNGGEYELFLGKLQQVSLTQLNFAAFLEFFTPNFIVRGLFYNLINFFWSPRPFVNLGFLLLFAALIYLTVTAQGSLIYSIYHQIKKKHKVNLQKSWRKARHVFWELLFTNILFKGGGLILAFGISWPLILILSKVTSLSIVQATLVVGLVVIAPILIVVSFLVKFTLIFIIAKKKDPLSAFAASLALFREHWLITLENALLLLLLNLLTGVVTLIVVLLLSFPINAVVAMTIYPLALPDGYYFTIIAWLMIIVGPILGSVVATFQYSSWVILFKKLLGKQPMRPKIARLANLVINKFS